MFHLEARLKRARPALALSKKSGKQISFQNLPQAEYRALLVKIGLPEPIADLLADSDAAAAKGALFDESHALSGLIGHPTAPIAQSIATAF